MIKAKKSVEPEKAPESIKLTVSEVEENLPVASPDLLEQKEVTNDQNVSGLEEIKVEENFSEKEKLTASEGIDKIFSSESVLPVEELKDEIGEKKEEPKEEIFIQPKQKNKKPVLKIILTFLFGFFLGGLAMAAGFYFLISPEKAKDPKTAENLSPTPVLEATAEPSPVLEAVDYSKYKINILNGSGVKGAAAEVKTLLEPMNITDIAVGNASVSNQKVTEVRVKQSVPDAFMEKVKSLLADYSISEGEELADSEKYDAVITIGVKSAE